MAGANIISSVSRTWCAKKIMPVMMFLIPCVGIVVIIITSLNQSQPESMVVIIVPLLMMGVFYLLFKFLIFDLMDEVQDHGDYLVVRFKSEEDRINISNIMNVNYTQLQNPPRATLLLRDPCRFGDKVSFIPLMPFSGFITSLHFKNAVVDDLIKRVDAARAK